MLNDSVYKYLVINTKENATMTDGYCVKCKKTVTMKDEKMTVSKRGMNTMKGQCPKCGTTVCRIMGKAKPDAAPAKVAEQKKK